MADERDRTQRIRAAVRALRHRNYRIYFFGMLVSFTGTWMQRVAQGWLIFLLGAGGTGALAGALTLAARRRVQGLGRVVALSVAALGASLVLFSLSRNLIVSTVLLAPVGFSLLLQMSASNTLVQTMVPDRMRGRLMSFYAMSLTRSLSRHQ